MATALLGISREYYPVPVYASADPTADTVEFAFTASRETEPGDDDWHTGDWDPATTVSPYTARILLGPGDDATQFADATYAAWLRITDDPEIPVRFVGVLVIS